MAHHACDQVFWMLRSLLGSPCVTQVMNRGVWPPLIAHVQARTPMIPLFVERTIGYAATMVSAKQWFAWSHVATLAQPASYSSYRARQHIRCAHHSVVRSVRGSVEPSHVTARLYCSITTM